MRLLALTVLLLALGAGPAAAADGTVAMADGVQLAYTLVEPAGAPPAGGRPAVVVMHGLGGSNVTMKPVAQYFADHGYAALAYSVRGQGGSGGQIDLAGPRDVADMKAMVQWLERRPGVSGRVGCFGISLGGGECWNATPAGIFDAVVPVATWTNLATALWPDGVARSGVLAGLASSAPALAAVAASSTTLPALALPLLAQRSVAGDLGRIHTPVYLVQGKVDYVFDVDQAVAAFSRLGGPRKLYVGDFGHSPSSFSSTDFPGFVLEQSTLWFDRFLRDSPNGIEQPQVVVRGGPSGAGLPATRIVHAGRADRSLETFGDSRVRVRVRSVRAYPRLVAVVRAGGKVVTHGAVVPKVGAITIPLADYVVRIPKGARITVRLDAAGDEAYAGGARGGGAISLGTPHLDLRVLR